MSPSGKSQLRKRALKVAPIAALLTLLLTIHLYLSSTTKGSSSTSTTTTAASHHKLSQALPARAAGDTLLKSAAECDLFTGKWVRNPEGPYYTNETCNAIQEHQNCMKFGRPDTEYLKWKWKPDGCDLPLFRPDLFLEMMRGKSLAFVGDSVARNHMQSLLCLLSKVARPVETAEPTGKQLWFRYKDYDFSICLFWAPYLVKTGSLDTTTGRPFDIYLDEPDDTWSSQVAQFNFVVISAGHWFFRPSYFHVNRTLSGCVYCPEPYEDIEHLLPSFIYRRAFHTAFSAINAAAGYSGVTFVRTLSPSHFEGGTFDHHGNCLRMSPVKRGEAELEEREAEFHAIQLEELGIAGRAGRVNGGRFVLFDATMSLLLRPDGHPSKYGSPPGVKLVMRYDCVHWCLPGPIDAWNDFLQELLRREIQDK
ncbi:protein trichome birefringence-like 19 [Salvia divinorum]